MGMNWTGWKGAGSYAYEPSVQAYDEFRERAQFEYKYSLIPRRCYITNRWIWGLSMRGRAIWTGPGDPVIEDRWYHRNEAIIMMLKNV